jgi:hypothetical protein
MKRSISTIFLTVLLSSCGGSDNSSGPIAVVPAPAPSPAPSPTPSPTPTPTPSPTPAPTASAFADLRGNVQLDTACGAFQSIGTNPPQVTGISGFGDGKQFNYNPEALSIRSLGDGGYSATEVPNFVSADIVQTTADLTSWTKPSGSSLTLLRPAGAETYTRLIDYILPGDGKRDRIRVLCLTGIPTLSSALPTTGSVTFTRTSLAGTAYYVTGLFDNRTVTEMNLGRSTLSLTVDFGRRLITTNIEVIGTPVTGGADMRLGSVQGTVTFAGDAKGLTVTTLDSKPATYVAAAGVSFGPQAQEAGLVLQFSGGTIYTAGPASASRSVNVLLMGAAGR